MNIKNIKTKYEEQFVQKYPDIKLWADDPDTVWQFFCKSMISVLEGMKMGLDNEYYDVEIIRDIDQLIAQLREEL